MYPLPLLILMVQSPTTPGQFDPFLLPQSNIVVKNPTIPGQFDPSPIPLCNLVVQDPTTPGQFDMWNNADIPWSDVPPSTNQT